MEKIFDRMKDLMFGEYEDDDDYYEDDYDTAAPAPAPVRENYGLRDARETEYSAPAPRKAASKNAANPQIYSVNTSVQMQVVIIKPECYEDAQEICDQIKTKRPVVVNLEKVEYPIAQRIMDFLSGTCYSLEGSIQRGGTRRVPAAGGVVSDHARQCGEADTLMQQLVHTAATTPFGLEDEIGRASCRERV